ncbi:MAG: hypothetical protein Kow0029_27980 [Candidatus Rifleibacteriota bacterium]
MTARSSLRPVPILFRMKVRLLVNTFFNWGSSSMIMAAVFALITMIAISYMMATGAQDLIAAMMEIPFGEFLLQWIIAIVGLYLITVVLTGDLITGHSLNTGQMSSDFYYLSTLPISPTALILVKLFERMLTDYIGLLLVLSGILGIIFRDGFLFSGLVAGLLIYFQVSLLIGIGLNIITISMQRFFRPATINNLFSVFGYLSAFLTLCPYLILSNFPIESLQWLIKYSDSFTSPLFVALTPMKWLAISLLEKGFCSEFLYWSAFWFLASLLGISVFYLMIKQSWHNVSHSAVKRKSSYKGRFFRGFFRKELMLLKSDYNMLINAVLMPISIIMLEIFFLKKALTISTSGQMLNIIYAAVIYFCMFGPVNSVGSEGKSISIIETLPISSHDFLRKKFFFWLVIAEIIFVPAAILARKQLGFNNSAILESAIFTFFYTAVCVWLTVHCSAIFPRYESKILQQKSSLGGKFAALCLMLLAAPVKYPDTLTVINFLVLLVAAILTVKIARACLENRLDPDFSAIDYRTINPYILIIIVYLGIQVSFQQFFRAVIPGVDTGLSAWFIAILGFLIVLILFAAKSLYGSNKNQIKEKIFNKPDILLVIVLLLITAGLSYGVSKHISDNPERYEKLSSDIKSMIDYRHASPTKFSDQNSEKNLLEITGRLLTGNYRFGLGIAAIILGGLIFEIVFRGFLLTYVLNDKIKAATLLSLLGNAIIVPSQLIGFYLISSLAAIIIFRKTSSVQSCWIFSTAFNLSNFLTLLFL